MSNDKTPKDMVTAVKTTEEIIKKFHKDLVESGYSHSQELAKMLEKDFPEYFRPVIKVAVTRERTLYTGDPRNFMVSPESYDVGDPLGHGETLEQAIEDFKENWLLKRDEEIEVEIVNPL